jgi:hypothetical protein
MNIAASELYDRHAFLQLPGVSPLSSPFPLVIDYYLFLLFSRHTVIFCHNFPVFSSPYFSRYFQLFFLLPQATVFSRKTAIIGLPRARKTTTHPSHRHPPDRPEGARG